MNNPFSKENPSSVDNLAASFDRFRDSWGSRYPNASRGPPSDDDRTRNIQDVVTAGFHRWDAFIREVSERGDKEAYSMTISTLQRSSYSILHEYFGKACHDEADLYGTIRQNLDAGLIEYGPIDHLSYISIISTLFFLELDLHESTKTIAYFSLLNKWRTEAQKASAAQRISYSCLLSWRTLHKTGKLNVRDEYSGFTSALPAESPPSEFPLFLWSIADEETVYTEEFEKCPEYTCISHTWGRWEVLDENGQIKTVSLDGVPWSIPCNSRFDVRQLPDMLRKTKWTTKYLWLDLVCIPQLTYNISQQALEIGKQASIFAFAHACVAWLNDVGSWDKIRSVVDWLSVSHLRQNAGLLCKDLDGFEATVASYSMDGQDLFRKSHFPLRGFSEADDSSRDIEETVPQQALEYHSKYCCSNHTSKCSTVARILHATKLSLRLPPFARLFGFPDWTTSLWTLQEACLCPDLSLASSNFEFLQTEIGLHIGLDAFISLIDSNLSSAKPPAVKQLRLCFPSTFGSTTPMEVMLMANERECLGARAPAIMSVLGFTDWYQKELKETGKAENSNSNLVLEKYPLAFVEEARAKVGPLFFATCPLDALTEGVGCMLPFYAGNDNTVTFPFEVSGTRKDTRVDSWKIYQDGHIEIPNAVIFAANDSNPYGLGPVDVDATFFGLPGTDDTSLQKILDSLCRSNKFCAFAIHLTQTTTVFIGIILLGLKSQITDTFILQKAGAYQIGYEEDQILGLLNDGKWPEIPAIKDVNWVVY